MSFVLTLVFFPLKVRPGYRLLNLFLLLFDSSLSFIPVASLIKNVQNSAALAISNSFPFPSFRFEYSTSAEHLYRHVSLPNKSLP